MFCPYCGTENENDSMFCAECGERIGNVAQSVQTGPQVRGTGFLDDVNGYEGGYAYEQPRRKPRIKKNRNGNGKGKGKLILLIAGIVVLCGIIAAALFVFGPQLGIGTGGEDPDDRAPFYARIDGAGTAYLPLLNGRYVQIDDVKTACLTPDRKRIVVLTKANELYFADTDLKNKVMIDDDMKNGQIEKVSDDCIIYRRGNDINEYLVNRYYKGEPISLGKTYVSSYIESNGNILYVAEGNIYLLTRSALEREKIGSYDREGRLLYLSKDGKKAIWVESDTSERNRYNVYMHFNGDREKLCSITGDDWPSLELNKTETYGLLGSDYEDLFYVIDINSCSSMKVGLGNPTAGFYAISTAKGNILNDQSSSFPGIYIAVDNDPDSNNPSIYYVDKTGEREKIISNVTFFDTGNGYLYYKIEDELRIAKLDGAVLKNDEKIAHDVDRILLIIGDYVYYSKDERSTDSGTYYSLYVSKKGNEPVKISDDVWMTGWYVSDDGEKIYYFIDPDNDQQSATFYKYVYGKKKPEKIADSVSPFTVNDGSYGRLSDRFTYLEKVDRNDYRWKFYDGKNSITMVKGLGRESVGY